MPLIEGLKLGDGIVIKDIKGIKFYRQVVNFAYKGYKIKEHGDEFGEIKRVDQCDVIRRMTEFEVNTNYIDKSNNTIKVIEDEEVVLEVKVMDSQQTNLSSLNVAI